MDTVGKTAKCERNTEMTAMPNTPTPDLKVHSLDGTVV